MRRLKRYICLVGLLALLAAAVLLGAALWAVTRSNEKAEQAAGAAAEGSIPLSSFAAEDLEQILSLIHI